MQNSLIEQTLKEEGLKIEHIPDDLSYEVDFKIDKPIKITKVYEHLKEEVRCGCGQKHKSGAIVLTESGKKALIGNKCAEREFGNAWTFLKREYEQEQDTVIYTSLVQPSLRKIAAFKDLMKSYHDYAKKKDDFFDKLKSASEDIFGKLYEVATHHNGEWLFSNTSEMATNRYREDFAMIDGYAAVGLQCRQRLVNIYQKMCDAERLLEIVPVKDKNVKEALKLYNDLLSKAGDIFYEIEMSKRFFTPLNLSTLVKAVEKDPDLSQGLVLRSQQLRVLDAKRKKRDFIALLIPYDFQTATFSRHLAA